MRVWAPRSALFVPLVAAAAMAFPPPAGAALGDLSFQQCYAIGYSSCSTEPSLMVANTGAAFSPDGTDLYLADRGADANSPNGTPAGNILIFSRSLDGTLIQTGCVNAAGTAACAAAPGLERQSDVAVSPDAHHVYVADW